MTVNGRVMNPKAGLQSLAAELQTYILSLLLWRDILRCTSVSHSFLLLDELLR